MSGAAPRGVLFPEPTPRCSSPPRVWPRSTSGCAGSTASARARCRCRNGASGWPATPCCASSTCGSPTAIVEPSLRDALTDVVDHPQWLPLDGRTVVVLGAVAEMGPLRSLLRWGADVAALDLPRADLWTRLLKDTGGYAGRLRLPALPGTADLAERAGVDLIHDLPSATAWVAGIDGPLVLGNYVYADGATNLRLSTAVDALTEAVRSQRPGDEVALGFLATPTDVFAVPPRSSPPRSRPSPSDGRASCSGSRCARWAAGGCCGATTSRGRTPASTTRSSCSRAELPPGQTDPTPVPTASASRSSSRARPTPSWRRCWSTTSTPGGAPTPTVAGRGGRRGARRAVADGIRPAQRAGSGRPARRRSGPVGGGMMQA